MLQRAGTGLNGTWDKISVNAMIMYCVMDLASAHIGAAVTENKQQGSQVQCGVCLLQHTCAPFKRQHKHIVSRLARIVTASCDLVLQALAELYHIQAPLFDSPPHPVTDEGQTQCRLQNAAQLPSPQAPRISQATLDTPAAANLAESFISSQQLGSKDTSDADDTSLLLKDSLAATDGGGHAGGGHAADAPGMTPGLLHASYSRIGDSIRALDPSQPRPLCSQEWKIQHVSFLYVTTQMHS